MLRRILAAGLATGLMLAAGALRADTPATALEEVLVQPAIQDGLRQIDDGRARAARLLADIGGIIAPSGDERERAVAVAGHMRDIGLADVAVSPIANVTGRIPGRSGKALVFVSTLDDLATVAGHQRAAGHPPVVRGGRVVGPGSNTSLTTVALLSAARALRETGFTPRHDLVFAAVAREETGLEGMKALYEVYRDRAVAFVDVLGEGEVIEYGGIGIHWWKVTASGRGGHTLEGGVPNVNQAIGRAVDRILQLAPSEGEATQRWLNVAVINSGSVFNHRPETGWFSLDVRALEASSIEALEDAVSVVLRRVESELDVSFSRERVNAIPPGQIPGARESELVQTAQAVSRYLG